LGISKKLNIKREKEIVFASLIGIMIAIGLPIFVFLFSRQASRILTEKNAEILESYLILGFFVSFIFGIFTYFGFLRFSINKVYKLTEFLIILLGASLVKNGAAELLEIYFDINLKKILPIKLAFLPHESTFFGHLLKNNFGLQQDFSLMMFFIIASYFILIQLLFLKRR
jgi:hypothetical protein